MIVYFIIYLLSLPERKQGTQRTGGSFTGNCCHVWGCTHCYWRWRNPDERCQVSSNGESAKCLGALLAINWAQLYHIKEKLNYPCHSLSDDMKNVVYLELMERGVVSPLTCNLSEGGRRD